MRLVLLAMIQIVTGGVMMVIAAGVSVPRTEYLSDCEERMLSESQGWGLLGVNTCAHAPGTTATPIQIDQATYAKGLGAHAPSEIVYALDGEFSRFESLVGLQKGQPGSVVFRVFADGTKVFDSGVVREPDGALAVSVSVEGAAELRLVVTEADDGIAHDCANWAEARLIAGGGARRGGEREPALDVASFAWLMTWDPRRMDGARNSRLEEFPEQELYPGRELSPGPDGCIAVPQSEGGSCIGLQWMERRRIRQLVLELADDSTTPPADAVSVQSWRTPMEGVVPGSTWWQGYWSPLEGSLRREGRRLVFDVDRRQSPPDARQGTFKIRWVLPDSPRDLRIRNLKAYTDSTWATVGLRLEAGPVSPGRHAQLELYNGCFVTTSVERMQWDTSAPLRVRVRFSKPRSLQGDRTVLRVQLPEFAFGVAVDDVLASGCVYVRDAGIFVAKEGYPVDLAAHGEEIRGRRTILEEVRAMPDQSFDSAMARVHRPDADQGPTALSLACHNRKYITARDGSISFDIDPGVFDCFERPPAEPYSCLFKPRYGSGEPARIRRTLDSGWMPIPTLTIQEGNVVYTQRTFVAPLPKGPAPEDSPPWFCARGMCVAEISAAAQGDVPVTATVSLGFVANVKNATLADAEPLTSGAAFRKNGKLLGAVLPIALSPLAATVRDGQWQLSGRLAPGQKVSVAVCIPGWDAEPGELPAGADVPALLEATRNHWNRAMKQAAEIVVPDPLLTNLIRASQVHCLLAARNEQGQRFAPWIASTCYGPLESEGQSVIRGMQALGHLDFARRAHDYYIHRYNQQGFLTTGYTVMGTGWHLWCLGEYAALSDDTGWLKQNAAEVARVCRWVTAQLEKTRRTDARGEKVPEYGLMPPGPMADWNAYAFYFYLNGYYCAGLNAAGKALERIGMPEGAGFVRQAAQLREDILRAFAWTQSRGPVYPLRNATWVPMYPSQVYGPCTTQALHPGQDAGRSWAYDVELGAHHLIPMGVIEPQGRQARWMMDHMEDVQFLLGGWHHYPAEKTQADWFNLGGFAKMQPYYARIAEVYALQDDVKPFVRTYFNTIPSLLNREDLSMWEHFFNGAFNKTHETGYFLHQTRLMLVQERGDELWLAPFVTSAWMRDGMKVEVRRAPTQFGEVSYRLVSRSATGAIEAEIAAPRRTRPSCIVLRLRHPEGRSMRSVTVNGAPHTDFDPEGESVRIRPGKGTIRVVALY